ncbi:hypothetical protein [Azohydromonas lata]|uniref:Uncharacterized protein n=1 Tax=Azohydromonas lata TaxID=45677 RepID=A0ABU5IQ38_9BURK|nr:hypothetical protein [Azohydromonas lata]MDZ5461024.1 hypothetical protein [Azohydromonas lata]
MNRLQRSLLGSWYSLSLINTSQEKKRHVPDILKDDASAVDAADGSGTAAWAFADCMAPCSSIVDANATVLESIFPLNMTTPRFGCEEFPRN